jgi:signal transduction histidine kinase
MFEYGFSTLEWEPPDESTDPKPAVGFRPLRGEGFGLPLCRQYARFFHGDISVQSTIGYGTEVHLRIREPRTTGAIFEGVV